MAADAVHVWRADLASADSDLTGLLSGPELERAERFTRSRDGELWARSRGVLRALLGRYLQREPRMLRIEAGTNGKPELLEDPGDPPTPSDAGPARPATPSFSLSHSGEIALYAFTAEGPVGVDVEVARRPIDSLALARRAFGPDEANRLAQLDLDSRELEFLRGWVRHEAALKLLGTGIGGKPAAGLGPWFADLEIGARAAAAVALAAPPNELRCWEWV